MQNYTTPPGNATCEDVSFPDERSGLPSASELEKIVSCPGSKQLSASIPKTPDVPGTLLLTGLKIHSARLTQNTLELSEEEEVLYKAGMNIERLALEQWMRDYRIESYITVQEERMWLHDHDLNCIASGKVDVMYISGNHALVCDWKTGFCNHVSPSSRNFQLRLYAVLAMQCYDVTQARAVLIKPRIQSGVDYTDYSEKDLQYSEQQIFFHLWEASQPDARRHPGEWCRYCPGKNGACDQAAAYSMLPSVIAKRAGGTITKKDDAMALVNILAPADLLRVWEVSGQVKWIIEGVDKRLKAMPEQQLAELGLELAPGRRLDPITEVRECVKHLVQLGWDEDAIWKSLTISKTDLAKLARQEKSLTSDKAASEWIADKLAEFITRKNSEGWLRKAK